MYCRYGTLNYREVDRKYFFSRSVSHDCVEAGEGARSRGSSSREGSIIHSEIGEQEKEKTQEMGRVKEADVVVGAATEGGCKVK